MELNGRDDGATYGGGEVRSKSEARRTLSGVYFRRPRPIVCCAPHLGETAFY